MKKFITSATFFFLFLLSYPCFAIEILNKTTLLQGLYALYSPELGIGAAYLYTAGWENLSDRLTCTIIENDHVIGNPYLPCDRIYRSRRARERRWGKPGENFSLSGKLVNEPTIIIPPSTDKIDRRQWRFMYYTVLDHSHYFPCGEGTNDCTKFNEIGLASSINNGRTWTNHGVVVGLENGLTYTHNKITEQCGAWSSSALPVGDKIYLWYIFNSQCNDLGYTTPVRLIGLTVFNANGWQIESQHFVTTPVITVNVSVQQRPDGHFLMAGNSGNQQYLYILESIGTDPTTFTWHTQMYQTPFVDADPLSFVLTPRLFHVTDSSWSILFDKVQKDFWFSTHNILQYDVLE